MYRNVYRLYTDMLGNGYQISCGLPVVVVVADKRARPLSLQVALRYHHLLIPLSSRGGCTR